MKSVLIIDALASLALPFFVKLVLKKKMIKYNSKQWTTLKKSKIL